MDVLAGNLRVDGLGVLALDTLDVVTELGTLSVQTSLHILSVVMLENTVFDRQDVGMVLPVVQEAKNQQICF